MSPVFFDFARSLNQRGRLLHTSRRVFFLVIPAATSQRTMETFLVCFDPQREKSSVAGKVDPAGEDAHIPTTARTSRA